MQNTAFFRFPKIKWDKMPLLGSIVTGVTIFCLCKTLDTERGGKVPNLYTGGKLTCRSVTKLDLKEIIDGKIFSVAKGSRGKAVDAFIPFVAVMCFNLVPSNLYFRG